MTKTSVLLRVLLGVACFACPGAFAQTYPAKPVRLIVPYAPGGGTDIMGRMLAERLTASLGQPVIVDNRPGSDGSLGSDIVARSDPDGYTLLINSSSHAINVALGKKLPYDTLRDLAPIVQTANQQLLLVVHPTVPVKSVAELIEYLKARPGKLNYGSSSNAVALPMELFKTMTGTYIVHIPYKGSGPMLNDLLGGQVQMAIAGAAASLPHVRGGKLRALGMGDSQRSASLPDIPTIAEAGVPDYHAVIWNGMFAPRNTPRPIIERLNREVVRILQSPDVRERMNKAGFDVVGSNAPEQWGKFLEDEIVKWTKIAKLAGMKAE